MTQTKAELRRHFADIRNGISPEARETAEQLIFDTLFGSSVWQKAPLVCGYTSMRSELRTDPIWQRAIADGKNYALPVTLTDAREGKMIFRRLSDYRPQALVSARFGIAEPPDIYPSVDLPDLEGALILVPGLAFDDQGFRIGYGGGYYDRFLAELRREGIACITVGLAFSACRTPSLPHDPHDIPVDFIIDERRLTPRHGYT